MNDPRLVLGIDTSERRHGGIALVSDDLATFEYRELPGALHHADALIPAISDLLEYAGVSGTELDGIAAIRGPGSFIGIRVGLAAAQALSAAWHVKACGVDTLHAMAWLSEENRMSLCPMIDARRDEIYTAVYSSIRPGLSALHGPVAVTCRQFVDMIPDGKIGIFGTGALVYEKQLKKNVGDRLLVITKFKDGNRAAAAAVLASFDDSNLPDHKWKTIDPLYLRRHI